MIKLKNGERNNCKIKKRQLFLTSFGVAQQAVAALEKNMLGAQCIRRNGR
jgi:hypothetical protein